MTHCFTAEDVMADREQRRVDEVEAAGAGELGQVVVLPIHDVLRRDAHGDGRLRPAELLDPAGDRRKT